MKFKLNITEILIFTGIGLLIALLPIFFTQNWTDVSFIGTGEIGDTIGGITAPFIAFFAAILVYLALKAQIEANTKIQQQFEIQKTESQFYTMLNLHIQNVDKFEIEEFDVHSNKTTIGKTKIQGRRVFLPMVTEFHTTLEIVYKFHNEELDSQNEALNTLAYQIFFYGIKSSHVKPIKNKERTFKEMQDRLISFQNTFRNKEGRARVFVYSSYVKFEVKTYYVPFSGHESRLAHYYRHLYQTVKQVYQAEQERIIQYEDSRRYLAILRAQLSNQEQLLLYYNYRCGFGESWDQLGGRYKFLTEYRMLHNIPLDDGRISEAFENPRKHFKDFIDSDRVSKEDPLFEWGDSLKK